MNSYNENLYSTVSASLLNLEQEGKNGKAQLDASMFTLYYSQGARITAAEQLGQANAKYTFQQEIKDQAVNNNNISVNLLYSANQQKSFTAQSVTNAAVCAANVQVASNAILRLASDIGSIYSMLGAADFGSEIYLQSRIAYNIMNDTAYDAEMASQSAMDASTATAEVSSTTVADEAKTTNDSVGNLFSVVSADFDAISSIVATDNANLASASAAEKVAEGSLEMINVEYYATRAAIKLNNQELNLGLTATPLNGNDITVDKRENDVYVVKFNYYKSPFSAKLAELVNPADKDARKVDIPAGYPVTNYYIMLVKDSKKTIFSIASAESLLLYKDRSIRVPGYPELPGQTYVQKRIHRLELKDADGDKMDLGKKYVVFVLAVLDNDYKRSINVFDDYLTAPSSYFKLTNHLASPNADTIKVDPNNHLTFKVAKSEFPSAYRCMFLPDTTALIKGLLSESALRSIEREVEKLEKIALVFEPVITQAESDVADLVGTHEGLTAKHAELTQKTPADDDEKEKIAAELAAIESRLETLPDEIEDAKKVLKHHQNSKAAAIRQLDPVITAKPGFFFNKTIAEQVSPANYYRADINNHNVGSVTIDSATTDNFGNLLIKGKSYIPVILTVADVTEDSLEKYTSSLSDYEHTDPFTYVEISKKK